MIEKLIKELRKDKSGGSYYYGWQSNIAMSISDELDNNNIILSTKDGVFTRKQQHKFVNDCAVRFLEVLIRDVGNNDNN